MDTAFQDHSFLHTKDLYHCVSSSLKDSHPAPQLQEQFDQAAGRSVQHCRPAERQTAERLAAISASTQSTLSIPPPPQQGDLVPSVINPLPQHLAASRIPHWPVPSIPPIPQRVPLAEKHDSVLGATNVPVEQLRSSPYNTRHPASRHPAANQLPAVSVEKHGGANFKGL